MYAGEELKMNVLNKAERTTERSENTCGTSGTGVESSLIDSILGRFSQPNSGRSVGVSLTQSERWEMMEASLDRIRATWNGNAPNWAKVDAINEKIGSTDDRTEFIRLLDEYERAFLAGGQPA